MFLGWLIKPERVAAPPAPPPYTIVTAKHAVLLTASAEGEQIVLHDDGKEVRRMTERQALNLIARLAMAIRDMNDGA